MMAGAPACGKGSAVATVASMAEEHLDIEWDNTVKVNTDTHRLMISHSTITGERSEFSGTLNNHEAGLLTDLAYSRLQKKWTKVLDHISLLTELTCLRNAWNLAWPTRVNYY